MSDRSWLPGGPVPTTIAIAAVAAITAGSLRLTGVAKDESPETADERIDRKAEHIVAITLETDPGFLDRFCVGDSGPIFLEPFGDASEIAETAAVQRRLDEKLEEACAEQDR